MRVTFDLDASDLLRFRHALARAARLARDAEEPDLIAAAKHALDHLPIATAPGYVRKRICEVQRLIAMLEDEAWALGGSARLEVLRTLVYFSDPEDLIPDDLPGIGLIDDAILLELLLRRQRHMIAAWDDFCRYRRQLGPLPELRSSRMEHARRLSARRAQLVARMKQRVERVPAVQGARSRKRA
jgi:hypothetical protein